jgi:hypothetical protein
MILTTLQLAVEHIPDILTVEKRRIQVATSSKPALETADSLIQWAYDFFAGSKTGWSLKLTKIHNYCGVKE